MFWLSVWRGLSGGYEAFYAQGSCDHITGTLKSNIYILMELAGTIRGSIQNNSKEMSNWINFSFRVVLK